MPKTDRFYPMPLTRLSISGRQSLHQPDFSGRETVMTSHGTYALIFRCSVPFQAVVGKLGPVFLSSGYWIYVGSAFGPGGLRSRLSHHLKPSRRPHWHLDYIKSDLRPVEIWTTTDPLNREHDWATLLSAGNGASRPIAGFGATDCRCRSHLIHMTRPPDFFCFTKQARRVIPARGPRFRFNLTKGPFIA
ncbi:MAG: GIY-YIG nuclease family protein [Desulfobacteraceae bacterium]|nr:GIY-YIG nuclease family protein [Desulfobacteraceae bacterium]